MNNPLDLPTDTVSPGERIQSMSDDQASISSDGFEKRNRINGDGIYDGQAVPGSGRQPAVNCCTLPVMH